MCIFFCLAVTFIQTRKINNNFKRTCTCIHVYKQSRTLQLSMTFHARQVIGSEEGRETPNDLKHNSLSYMSAFDRFRSRTRVYNTIPIRIANGVQCFIIIIVINAHPFVVRFVVSELFNGGQNETRCRYERKLVRSAYLTTDDD